MQVGRASAAALQPLIAPGLERRAANSQLLIPPHPSPSLLIPPHPTGNAAGWNSRVLPSAAAAVSIRKSMEVPMKSNVLHRNSCSGGWCCKLCL